MGCGQLCGMCTEIDCQSCPFGFLGQDVECPAYASREEAVSQLRGLQEKLENALRLLEA